MKKDLILFSVIFLTIVFSIVFLATIVKALFYLPDEIFISGPATPNSSPNPIAFADPRAASEYPMRVRIPSLNIDAHVQNVGINAKGNMAVPNNYQDVAWFEPGTMPGAKGSSVIAGHVNNGLGLDGVFAHLSDLKVNDDIYIITRSGAKLRFSVTQIESYPFNDAPADLIFNQGDAARVNLITCEGVWLPQYKTYDRRLVVFTKFVGRLD